MFGIGCRVFCLQWWQGRGLFVCFLLAGHAAYSVLLQFVQWALAM